MTGVWRLRKYERARNPLERVLQRIDQHLLKSSISGAGQDAGQDAGLDNVQSSIVGSQYDIERH